VSAPAAARVAGGAASRDALRRRYSPPGPRRVSGPARRAPEARPVSSRLGRGRILLSLISALRGLANHRLLDRLLRGRAWLVVVTFALIGIVTLQLALLKLNGAVGRALHSQALLQRENAQLSIENSELSAADRVQAGAAQLGLAFRSSASLGFLAPSFHGDFARGAAALGSPLHVPATGSEAGSAGRAGGSSGEAGSTERGEGPSGESRSRESGSGESHPVEGRSGESGASEARTSEAAGSSSAPAGGETSSSPSPSASAASEAPAAAQAPARSAEGSGTGESSSGGGTPAGPNG
jgi:hypothetical protein